MFHKPTPYAATNFTFDMDRLKEFLDNVNSNCEGVLIKHHKNTTQNKWLLASNNQLQRGAFAVELIKDFLEKSAIIAPNQRSDADYFTLNNPKQFKATNRTAHHFYTQLHELIDLELKNTPRKLHC